MSTRNGHHRDRVQYIGPGVGTRVVYGVSRWGRRWVGWIRWPEGGWVDSPRWGRSRATRRARTMARYASVAPVRATPEERAQIEAAGLLPARRGHRPWG